MQASRSAQGCGRLRRVHQFQARCQVVGSGETGHGPENVDDPDSLPPEGLSLGGMVCPLGGVIYTADQAFSEFFSVKLWGPRPEVAAGPHSMELVCGCYVRNG